jgi:hypothetical protein
MRSTHLIPALCLLLAPIASASGQFSLGLGGGVGVGSRGGSSGGAHGNASLELKLPILPGIRGDLHAVESSGDGKLAASVNAVIYAPIPVLSPYLIAGWGTYGLGGSSASTGWNLGVGAKASIVIGPALFIEVRRHQHIARDLVTVGVRF